jgi:glutamate-ammonia-ligase adenylyltransferase
VYRRAQQLRIGLRDLLGFAPLTEVWAECSALAEASLVFTAGRLGSVEDLTIVALGKFGGGELGYGADLDVLFIGADASRAAELTRAMTEVTPEGRVFPVDARLRPEGESGLMAVTLQAWIDYFERGRGDLWEAQALTKARPIAGPEQATWLEAAQRVWREHGRRADLRKRIQCMLQKIAEHRGADPVLDFKTGPGGVMQLEFYTQANQMQSGFWEPNTLKALANVAPGPAIQPLTEAYTFLRRIETVLRRQQDSGVSRIPSDALEQARLARRCGFSSRDAFLEATQCARATIARLARL